MSGMTLGNMVIGGGAPEAVIKSFLMLSGKVICFEQDVQGEELYMKMPLVLESAVEKGEVKSFFRPLVPMGPETKFRVVCMETMICEIVDSNLKSAYLDTAQKMRAQMSGIEIPGQPLS